MAKLPDFLRKWLLIVSHFHRVVLYSDFVLNSTQFDNRLFLCRLNGSQLKLHIKVADINVLVILGKFLHGSRLEVENSTTWEGLIQHFRNSILIIVVNQSQKGSCSEFL